MICTLHLPHFDDAINMLRGPCRAGVGISGQEGMQAVMSSDFAIAQFRFLEPLLLVHGRWSYLRITRMVSFFFYKNLLFGATIFAYNVLCFFSGQILYNGAHLPNAPPHTATDSIISAADSPSYVASLVLRYMVHKCHGCSTHTQ